MKINYITLFLMLTIFTLSNAIEVGGHITEDTTWSPVNNPYLVNENIFVDSDATLTIHPGTQIQLGSALLNNENYVNGELFMLNGEESVAKMFWVDGRVIANGTENQPINFTRNISLDYYHWGTIYFNAPSTKSEFTYCRFEYSSVICLDTSNEANGTFTGQVANLSIKNCDFVDNYGGINLNLTDKLEVTNSSFEMEMGMNPEWVGGTFQYVNIEAEEETPGNLLFCGNNLPENNLIEIVNCNMQLYSNNISVLRCSAEIELSAYISKNDFNCDFVTGLLGDNSFEGFGLLYIDNNSFISETSSICSIEFLDGIISNNIFKNTALALRNYPNTEQKLIINNIVEGWGIWIYDEFEFYNNIIDSASLNIGSNCQFMNCFLNPSSLSMNSYNQSLFQNCFIFNFGGLGSLQFMNCILSSSYMNDYNDICDNISIYSNEFPEIFVNFDEKDFHLSENSIAIDAGMNNGNNYQYDLDMNHRFRDGDNNGSTTVDIGPYEYDSRRSGGAEFIVYDSRTGEPIEYALVKFDGDSGQFAFTNADGRMLHYLPSGMYNVTIERMFQDQVAEFQIEIVEGVLAQAQIPLISPVTDSEPVSVPDLNSVSLTNYPNPFNPSTTISFNLTTEYKENTEIVVYNLKGQSVVTLSAPMQSECIEGRQSYSITWNGTDNNNKQVSSGIYFAILKSENRVLANRKMILLK